MSMTHPALQRARDLSQKFHNSLTFRLAVVAGKAIRTGGSDRGIKGLLSLMQPPGGVQGAGREEVEEEGGLTVLSLREIILHYGALRHLDEVEAEFKGERLQKLFRIPV